MLEQFRPRLLVTSVTSVTSHGVELVTRNSKLHQSDRLPVTSVTSVTSLPLFSLNPMRTPARLWGF